MVLLDISISVAGALAPKSTFIFLYLRLAIHNYCSSNDCVTTSKTTFQFYIVRIITGNKASLSFPPSHGIKILMRPSRATISVYDRKSKKKKRNQTKIVSRSSLKCNEMKFYKHLESPMVESSPERAHCVASAFRKKHEN